MKTIMEKARHAIDNVGELPQIPSVILNSMTLLNDPSVTVRKIQEQILLDQALTAYVLKVANSALYGLRRGVSTVSHAINLMGYNTTKSVLLASLTKNLYRSKGNKLIQNILWKHSISSALFAKRIAELLKKVNSEEAFISALLHDIGKGVLLKNRTEDFEQAVQKIYNDNLTSLQAEQGILSFTHVEVGFLLMKSWGFAENIIETVIFHNNLEEYSGDNTLVPIVSLANKLSHLHNFSFSKGNYELFELQILKISEEDLKGVIEQSVGEVEKYLEIFT